MPVCFITYEGRRKKFNACYVAFRAYQENLSLSRYARRFKSPPLVTLLVYNSMHGTKGPSAHFDLISNVNMIDMYLAFKDVAGKDIFDRNGISKRILLLPNRNYYFLGRNALDRHKAFCS